MTVRRVAIALSIVLTTLVFAPSPAGADSEPRSSRAEHCSMTIIGQKPSGEFIMTRPSCADTPAAAQALDRQAMATEDTAMMAQVLAIHYKGSNFSGSSLTINGVDCNGGWHNLNSSWTNKVVSTRNMYCLRTTHYDLPNKVNYLETHYSNEVNHTYVCCISSIAYWWS